MIDWFVQTLRSYPEIAIFLSLAFGYYFGSFTYKGLGLGAVTATLIAAVIIGQLGITISGPLKPTFFLMFLFAIGYGVGPQFVRGIAQDGIPQALFAVVVCVFCLAAAYLGAKLAGYDVGSAAGLYAGSQTISASMGLATDAINRLGLSPEETQEAPGWDAGRLCRHLHLRHDRIGDRSCALRTRAPWHRPRGRVQALRGRARRQEGSRRSRHCLAPIRAARIPRPRGRTGRRQDGAGSRGAAFPISGCSSNVFDAAARSSMRPRTP